MIRVILVDDHALIRRGLRESLSEAGDIEVVGEACDYGELRQLLRAGGCDVLLLDVNLPGRSGIDVLRALVDEGQSIRVVVLSTYPEDQYGIRALKAGAMAYLNKAADPEVIVQAVRTVAAGRKYVTPEVAQALADSVSTRTGSAHEQLSDREMQTLVLIAEGRKLAEIAERLSLSPKTVSVYRARVLEKLKLSSNAELATYAMRNQLIDLGPAD
jgi:DNA-binding NarL/FixJ family response regulator